MPSCSRRRVGRAEDRHSTTTHRKGLLAHRGIARTWQPSLTPNDSRSCSRVARACRRHSAKLNARPAGGFGRSPAFTPGSASRQHANDAYHQVIDQFVWRGSPIPSSQVGSQGSDSTIPESRPSSDKIVTSTHDRGIECDGALNLQHDSVVMDRLAEITVPTLVLAGGADRPEYTASGQYIEHKMAHARVVVVEGGEHAMHEASHAAEVAEIIAEFVAFLPPVA